MSFVEFDAIFIVPRVSDVTCIPTVEYDGRCNDTVDVICDVISEDIQVRYANVAFEVEETFTYIVNLNMSDFCPFEPTAWKLQSWKEIRYSDT